MNIPEIIRSNISLQDKNWFCTGGAAQWYSEPATHEEISAALAWAHAHKIPVSLLGQGANILVHDSGVPGLVVRLALDEFSALTTPGPDHHKKLVRIGAGVPLSQAIEKSLDAQLLGLEEFSGIPGTIGGSVYINVHYYEYLLSNFLISGTIIAADGTEIKTVPAEWFELGYDSSRLQKKDYYLLDALFSLTPGTSDAIIFARGRRTEIIRHRTKRYPHERTCGSFFRNFHPTEIARHPHLTPVIYAGYYLDLVGVKGTLKSGHARVSHQHANMLIADPGATSHDIITLARKMQELVWHRFGILLQPECQFIGFSHYPLYTHDSISL